MMVYAVLLVANAMVVQMGVASASRCGLIHNILEALRRFDSCWKMERVRMEFIPASSVGGFSGTSSI